MQPSVRAGGTPLRLRRPSLEGPIALLTVKEIFDLVRDDLVRSSRRLAEQTGAASEPVGEDCALSARRRRQAPASRLLLLSARAMPVIAGPAPFTWARWSN